MLDFNLDSIVNAFTRLGTSKDRHTDTQPGAHYGPFEENQLDDLYLGGRINRRIVDRPPQDATRRGWQVRVDDDEIDESNPFEADMKRLRFRWKARRAHKLARQSGGALMFFVCDDANPPSEPVDDASLQGVDAIHVLDRFEVTPANYFKSVVRDEWRDPERWEIREHTATDDEDLELDVGDEIHSDRVVKWEGLPVPEDRKSDYDGFGQPVLENCWEAIRDLETATSAMATATHQFQYRILKLKDLNSLLRGPDGDVNESKLKARLNMIREGMSFLRMIVLDSEEELETRNVDFSSIVEIYAVFQQNVSACATIPITLLFGQAPQGFNSEDRTAIQNYYDWISGTQQEKYRPAIDKGVRLLSKSSNGPTGGRVPDDWSVGFRPLEEPTDAEAAETRKTIAEADAVNIDRGVYGSDEARERYTGDELELDLAISDDEGLGGFSDAAETVLETGGAGETTAEAVAEEIAGGNPYAGPNDPELLDDFPGLADRTESERAEWLAVFESVIDDDEENVDEAAAAAWSAIDDEQNDSRGDAVTRWNGPGDSSLPETIRRLDHDARRSFVSAWNATVDMAADLPDDELANLAQQNAERALRAAGVDLEEIDDRGDAIAGGQITGTDLQPFVEPPDRVTGFPEETQQLFVESYNKFLADNAEEFDDDSDLREAALNAAWKAVIAESS